MIDDFTKAYIEAALWSSSAELGDCDDCDAERVSGDGDERCPKCGGRLRGADRSFQDLGFATTDIDPESLTKMSEDCASFQAKYDAFLEHWYGVGESSERAGHDFWLTRNGHGAGFWDRYFGGTEEELGRILTAAAETYGECYLYVGDDGRIYVL
jgi:hypothetical protein